MRRVSRLQRMGDGSKGLNRFLQVVEACCPYFGKGITETQGPGSAPPLQSSTYAPDKGHTQAN